MVNWFPAPSTEARSGCKKFSCHPSIRFALLYNSKPSGTTISGGSGFLTCSTTLFSARSFLELVLLQANTANDNSAVLVYINKGYKL